MDILDINTYKEYQGIQSNQNDTKIIKTLKGVNNFIRSYCNRTFVDYFSTPKTEYFDATQKEYYPLEFPIINITSIKYSSNNDGDYDTALAQYTDYIIDDINSRIVAIGDQFIYNSIPINSGQLIYTAGYNAYPDELIQAAVLLTEYFVSEAYNPRKSLAGASVDHIIQPDFTAKLPPHIRRILEHYRAWNW